MSSDDRVFHARWIIPISSEPINGGWLRVQRGRIVETGLGRAPTGSVDLGDVALLPQLINTHTHLEFSDCRCPIGTPGMPLAQWIGEVVAARSRSTDSNREHLIELGLQELIAAGTCLAAEIATPPSNYAATDGQLSLVTFAEVLGLNQERADDRFAAADAHCQLEREAGISPHAPYSTSTEMITKCIKYARDQRRPLAMHVAESPAERELLFEGSGPFVAALKSIGAWRDGLFPWVGSDFVGLIDQLSTAPRSLLIHGNDLTKNEIERLAAYPQMTPVYCPRTHRYFDYQCHPVQQMLTMGIRVALGTDSRASNPDLNVWREVQYLLRQRQDIVPHDVLQMATRNGAIALGRIDLGTLDVGAQARIGVVHTEAVDLQRLYEDLSVTDFRVLYLSDD